MIIGIIIALFVTVIVYLLASLAVRKLSPEREFVLAIWLIAVVIIVLVWWNRVLEPLVGPLP